jgi:molybdate/tungstate transport system substrate-binding protein
VDNTSSRPTPETGSAGKTFAMENRSYALRRNILILFFTATALLLPSCHRAAYSPSVNPEPLIVFNAGSLTAPIADLFGEFARRRPQVALRQESSGSLEAVRKITELGERCDVLAVADYDVIAALMIPQHADWYTVFARNQLVLMYTPRSKFSGEVSRDNWFEILRRPEVQYGYSNPDLDPAGYRTLLHWQLAEKFYHCPELYQQLKAGAPARNIRPKSVELVALLQSGELDYIYGYRSVAEQNNLQFVAFPPEIDFSDPGKADFYATASIEVAGKSPGEKIKLKGLPILYGLTIPRSAPHQNLAEEFLEFIWSPDGQAVMQRDHLTAVSPPQANSPEKLPGRLKDKVILFRQ